MGGGDKKSGCQNSDKAIIEKVDTKKELSKIANVPTWRGKPIQLAKRSPRNFRGGCKNSSTEHT